MATLIYVARARGFGRYPWHMPGIQQPRICANILGICHGYLPIFRGMYPNPNPYRKKLVANRKCGLQLKKIGLHSNDIIIIIIKK